MDFGLTDDQRDIQRTARDLLSERSTFARVREHAEARSTDKALWRELCELGWPGIAISEDNGGQGLGTIELSILCEELGRSLAPGPFLASGAAADPRRCRGPSDPDHRPNPLGRAREHRRRRRSPRGRLPGPWPRARGC